MLLLNNVRPDGMKIKKILRRSLSIFFASFWLHIATLKSELILSVADRMRLQSYAAQYPDELGNLPKVSC